MLIVLIQAEIDREAALVAEASAPQFQPRPVAATSRAQFTASSRPQSSASPRSQFSASPRPQFAASPRPQRRSDESLTRRSEEEEGHSAEDRRAIQKQLDLQAENVKALKLIVDRQTEVNRRHLMGSVAQ